MNATSEISPASPEHFDGSDEANGSHAGGDRTPIRVLLVDDDELFRESLAGNLTDEQFDLTTCENGAECLQILERDPQFDIVLLDWRMPDVSGIQVMQEVKAAKIDVPIVFLTAFASERNEEAAFDCGAVDFLDKSRSGAVLARRIRVLVSRERGQASDSAGAPEVLRLGDLDVHFRVNRAYWKGKLVPLTTTEFKVVQVLASRAGEDVSYRAIYDVVHGPGFIAGNGYDGFRTNVRSLIKRIRQKFCRIDPEFAEIENYRGFGYRWHQIGTARSDDTGSEPAAPDRIVDGIAKLPFMQSLTLWRPSGEGNGDPRQGSG